MPTKKIVVTVPGQMVNLRVPQRYNFLTVVQAAGTVSIQDANSNLNEGLIEGDAIEYPEKQPRGLLGLTSTVAETVLLHYGDDEKLVHKTVYVINSSSAPVQIGAAVQNIPSTAVNTTNPPTFLNVANGVDYKFALLSFSAAPINGQTITYAVADQNGTPILFKDQGAVPVYDLDGNKITDSGTITLPSGRTSGTISYLIPLYGGTQVNLKASAALNVSGQFTNSGI